METLSAPWRIEYIRSLEKPDGDACFICLAAAARTDEERRHRLVLWESEQCLVLINRYPYSNGHLLVAPKAHKSDLEQLTDAEHLQLQQQTTEAVRLLKRAISAQGFNLGTNLGRSAGAGLPGHFHQHVVPRWSGDINFMSVVGDVRVVPQATSQLYEELLRLRKSMTASAG
jgi:ATP adenylyltransferase